MYTQEEKICILFGEYGVSATKFFKLWNSFDGISDFLKRFSSSQTAEDICGESFATLCKALKDNKVENIIDDMESNGVVAVTTFSESFPEALANIDDPPYVLFCKGNVNLLSSRCFAVVGTRNVSSYGRRVAIDFTRKLCEKFTIVSGLAYGVDSLSHETTLEENGKTIAVLGSGVLYVYPSANQSLYENIIDKNGLIVSEYGLRAEARSYFFPHRNRLISGLSVGLLVCQASLKSGTNTTVNHALQQGRDVFVVPGEIYDFSFQGNNAYIKSMQGAMVTNPCDILDYYSEHVNSTDEKASYQMSIEEQLVANALSSGQKSFDELVEETNLSIGVLNYLLANLELKSIIARLPGNFYRLYGEIK